MSKSWRHPKYFPKKGYLNKGSCNLSAQFVLVFLIIDNYLFQNINSLGNYFPCSTNRLPGTFCESKLIPACFIGIAILAKLYQTDIFFISRILYLTQENQSTSLQKTSRLELQYAPASIFFALLLWVPKAPLQWWLLNFLRNSSWYARLSAN